MPPTRDTFVHRWFEQVWNQGNLDAIDRMMAPDAAMHGLGEGAGVLGAEAFKSFVTQLRSAFPDMRITVVETIEEGDMIAGRWTATMTHSGDDLGVAATGRRVGVTGMSMARLRDGVMIEGWNNWDAMALMEQIGALHQGVRLVAGADA
ncbi:MAG TPA: ester cyclase [Gemmatimonadaceae bacterium]|nr:ester cyclase [Gemmatimonadaceae bacterium]